MPVSADDFRHALSRFTTGVTIVTTKNDQGVHGLTANAFMSVSLEPPLIAICIKKRGISHEFLSASDRFIVNILSQEQQEAGATFADPRLSSEERFARVSFTESETGIPILDGSLAHLECRIVNHYGGGDHTIFVGEVEATAVSEEAKPLLYYASAFRTF